MRIDKNRRRGGEKMMEKEEQKEMDDAGEQRGSSKQVWTLAE